MNRTLAIIKPDAVRAGKAGLVLAHLEGAGFTVRAAKMTRLSDAQAGEFYAVHREPSFAPFSTQFREKVFCGIMSTSLGAKPIALIVEMIFDNRFKCTSENVANDAH